MRLTRTNEVGDGPLAPDEDPHGAWRKTLAVPCKTHDAPAGRACFAWGPDTGAGVQPEGCCGRRIRAAGFVGKVSRTSTVRPETATKAARNGRPLIRHQSGSRSATRGNARDDTRRDTHHPAGSSLAGAGRWS